MLVKIKDVCQVVSGATPSTSNPSFYDGNICWITPKDLADNGNRKFIDNCGRKITTEGYNSCSTVMIPSNNILISTRAPIGYIAINKVDCCTNQGFKSLICDKQKVVVDYLFYLLKSRMNEIELLGSGTTFKEVSKTSIENFEIDLPALETQEKIASILTKIDKQIERNNAMVKKLQVLSQGIFNRFYGKKIYNFNGILHRICELPSGYAFEPAYYDSNGKYQLITIKNVNGVFVDNQRIDRLSEIPAKMKSYCKLDIGDILLSLTGNVGRISINTFENSLLNQRVSKMICENKYKFYLYMLLNTDYYQEKLRRMATGTSQKNLSPIDVENLSIYIPDNINDFNDATLQILNQLCQLNSQSNKLQVLKSYLLPLLINGQLE